MRGSKASRLMKVCFICNKSFSVQLSKFDRITTCSKECGKQTHKRRALIGSLAARSIAAKQKRFNTFEAKRLNILCGCGCGIQISISQNAFAQKKRGKKFLNREHYENWFRGSNVLWWVDGLTNEYGSNWKEERQEALIRDGFECRGCRSKNNLVVHHIRPFKKSIKEKANIIGNLITLCRPCHGKVHGTGVGALIDQYEDAA
jgi:5-methylcytosine-specific restriction endonuclease McrA